MNRLARSVLQSSAMANLESDVRDLIASLLQTIERNLSEKLTLKDALETMVKGAVDGFADRMVNVLEDGEPGPCRPILLARCQIRPPGVRPMHSVMRQVRQHLLRCVDTTRVVLLLTDHWNPKDIDESQGDLLVHASRPLGAVILPILVSNGCLHPLAFDPKRC